MGLRARGTVAYEANRVPALSRGRVWAETLIETFTQINTKALFCFMEAFETLMTMKIPVLRTRCILSHTHSVLHTVPGASRSPRSPSGDLGCRISPSVDRTAQEAARSYPEGCF